MNSILPSNTTDGANASVVLPPLNLYEIYLEDQVNDAEKNMPYRYGIERAVYANVLTDGKHYQLENGDRVWELSVYAPGALNISVNFNNFFLPQEATLIIHNSDYSDHTRTFTNSNNRFNDKLATWFVEGDYVIIKYTQPEWVTETPKLSLESIIQGYRSGSFNLRADGTRDLNDSGGCNYDVNCPIGDDFDTIKDEVKKSIALVNLGNGFLCTAALINNTNEDKTPYLLTANHCLQASDPAYWVVRFNWMSPNPVCASLELSTDLQTNFTMSGATLRANNALSDFALVELYEEIPQSWDISFAGWDHTDEEPLFEIGIHHPNGDIMKVSRDDTGAVKHTANDTEVWLIKGISAGDGDGWEIGTTESGSSGSPLFNENGSIIGQLYSGQSSCNNNQTNNEFDVYGRFAVSWDAGTSTESRLSDWLDPMNTGQQSMSTLQNILNIPDTEIIGALDIYPNPATDIVTVMNTRFPNLSYNLYDINGQKIMSGSMANTLNYLPVDALLEGVYFLNLIDGDSQSTITKKILVDR